ncbi:MAG: ABC transporter transmembrane domain-containing protein, partial [Saprospiraceae bacterium]|nr:ABC transporter transmembrane domain-containing protein [Saprospiraceae bacterium]
MSNKEENKAVDKELLRRLYFFIEPYKWYVLLGIVLTLSASFLGTVRPKLTQIAVDQYIANKDFQGLLWIIFLLGLALVGEFIILVANTYLTRWFGQGALYNLRNAVFKKIQSLHVQFFDKNPIGRLITRSTSDIETLSDLLSDGVVNMIGDLFRIFFILYFMF